MEHPEPPVATTILETPQRNRLFDEVALHQAGFVPITAYDAPYSRFDETLPSCHVQQVVPGTVHGRVVWSHPGRSGLDPRAVAPLALVRVADGIGGEPLDPPMTLADAVRWLLDGDLDGWLARPRHRVLVGRDHSTCLYELDHRSGRCLSHPLIDPPLQEIAEVFGDVSYADCCARSGNDSECTTWGPQPVHGADDRARCALAVVHRLGLWHVEGVRGCAAWDLARQGVDVGDLAPWHDAGFTTAEVGLWWAVGGPRRCARLRSDGRWPYRHLLLPPVPGPPDHSGRGLHWYAQFQLARRGRSGELRRCRICHARDHQSPCRTCVQEGRTTRSGDEWPDYLVYAGLHTAFVPVDPRPTVACGAQDCRTPLSLSVAAEGAAQ
jgi:hypothetical protein